MAFAKLNALARQSRDGAIADLQAHCNAKLNTAQEIVRRLKRQRTLLVPAGGKRLATLNQIREQSVGEITSASQAKAVMDAITGIKEGNSEIFEYANGLMNQALEFWGADRGLVSYLRKAASRLDELVCDPHVPNY